MDLQQLPEHLLEAAISVAETLRSAGYGAWIVGGAVRDLALGLDAGDLDIATEATPERLEPLFPGSVGVGRAFGTLIVPTSTRNGRVPVEVTTFRRESGFSDARHPDRVEYGASLEEDARRRDFTMNALFLDPLSGELRDPASGLDDLRQGRLRTVGKPAERFEEDALRLLRLARFAGRYDLQIEPDTLEAAIGCGHLLERISRERIAGEWRKSAGHAGFAAGLEASAKIGILELAAPGASQQIENRIALARELESLTAPPRLGADLAFAVLFEPLDPASGFGASESFEGALASLATLKPSRAESNAAQRVWEFSRNLAALDRAEFPRAQAIRLARSEEAARSLCYARARAAVLNHPPAPVVERVRELTLASADVLRPAPWLDSRALLAAGLSPGPELGRLLVELEDRQLEGLLTDREAALDYVASQRHRF